MPEPGDSTRLSVFHSPVTPATLSAAQLDEVVHFAMRVSAAPLGGVSFVDENGLLVSAGVPACVSGEYAFCRATLDGHQPLVVYDAHAEPQFADCALVLGPPFL